MYKLKYFDLNESERSSFTYKGVLYQSKEQEEVQIHMSNLQNAFATNIQMLMKGKKNKNRIFDKDGNSLCSCTDQELNSQGNNLLLSIKKRLYH